MSGIELEKIEAITNDRCNSQCVGQLRCSQMWSINVVPLIKPLNSVL